MIGASNEQTTGVTPENMQKLQITAALYNLSLKIRNRVRIKTVLPNLLIKSAYGWTR